MLLKDFKKILINQTAFIGDVVLTLPLVQKIKEISPDSEVDFLTTPQSAEIPALIDFINEIITFDKRNKHKGIKGINQLINELRRRKYDLIISPHRSFRTTIINYFSDTGMKISFDKSSLSFLYDKRVEYKINQHEKERNISLISVFDDFNNYSFPYYSLKYQPNDVDIVEKLLVDYGILDKKFVVIAPGSVWATKRWKVEYFQLLAKMLSETGVKVILTGSVADMEICDIIGQVPNIINIAGKTSITQTIMLISKAEYIITNDSSPIHFAGLTNTKTFAIFGPTVPKFGFSPTGKNDVVIQNNNLKCRPCSIHGGNKCPLEHHKCMSEITPEMVFKIISSHQNLLTLVD